MMLLHCLDISKASGYAVSTENINSVHKMTHEATSVVYYTKNKDCFNFTGKLLHLMRHSGGTGFFGTTLQSSCDF